MSSKDDCKKEIKAVNARNSAQIGFEPLVVTKECILHRLVSEHHYLPDRTVELSGLEESRFSVYVEGPGFPEFRINDIVDEFKRQQYKFVAAFKFPARVLLEMGKYTFLHDPYPFQHHKTLQFHDQHPNHAQVICTKDIGVALAIRESILEWTLRP